MKEQLSRRLHFRMSECEFDRLQKLAAANGFTASSTIRYLIRYCSLPIVPPADLSNEQRREFEH